MLYFKMLNTYVANVKIFHLKMKKTKSWFKSNIFGTNYDCAKFKNLIGGYHER